MHPRAMIPNDEMPLMSKGNQNFHGEFTSSSHSQASPVDDELPPILVDVSPDVSYDELPELTLGVQGNNQGENQDADSENVQLDEQPTNDIPRKRKRYHRHSQYQIQGMEAFFKECPHPDEKQRRELGRELGLEPLQVKFWFQNKRTQMKAQHERKENAELHAENEKLRCENIKLKQSISVVSCSICSNPCIVAMSSEERQLRLEKARLIQEIERLTVMARTVFGNTANSPTCPSSLNQGSLEFKVGAFGGKLDNTPFGDIVSRSESFRSLKGPSELDKSLIIELAISAVEEVAAMARISALWIPDPDRNTLMLNEQEYFKTFQRGFVPKSVGFKAEASRECAIVKMSPFNILQIFMELSKWLAVFSSMISRAMLLEVLSIGVGGKYNGAMQVMSAEFQVLSPAVPTRDYVFVRYCKQLSEETWAVVDVSVDALFPRVPVAKCQRRPSGCIIQAMSNGCSKIIWVEHVEVQDQIIHSLSKSIISSGYAYGAKRWISVFERQCERLASAMLTNYPYYEDLNEIVLANPECRKSFLKLAERMVLRFCGGVTASSDAYHWTTVSGNGVDEVRIMTRNSIDDPGRPAGVVLSASICFWIPVLPKTVFDYLRNESNRAEWDILSNGGGVQEMACIGNGQERGNCVTILRVTNPHTIQGKMLILQESSSEPTMSFIVYSPVDVFSVNMLFAGGNPDKVQLLPSGFTILPSGPPGCEGGIDDDAITNGTLLSIAFQFLVDSAPYAKLCVASVPTVNNLIERTIEKIKTALDVN